jgi:hypothetical protein
MIKELTKQKRSKGIERGEKARRWRLIAPGLEFETWD